MAFAHSCSFCDAFAARASSQAFGRHPASAEALKKKTFLGSFHFNTYYFEKFFQASSLREANVCLPEGSQRGARSATHDRNCFLNTELTLPCFAQSSLSLSKSAFTFSGVFLKDPARIANVHFQETSGGHAGELFFSPTVSFFLLLRRFPIRVIILRRKRENVVERGHGGLEMDGIRPVR